MADLGRVHIEISGLVQGVGFRPFVYRLACEHGLTGWVSNSSRGVEIEVEGRTRARERFLQALATQPPLLARIEEQHVAPAEPIGESEFVIRQSVDCLTENPAPILADIATCPDCLRELFDPSDRRYLYPFTNCTHCGPRFTLVTGVPYDRPRTTMSGFPLCSQCRAEYENPSDRRFHAQPVACPVCGPQLTAYESEGCTVANAADALAVAKQWIEDGRIVALKGLGGYHLACDARNESACRELRIRKTREDKPFATMVRDVAHARRIGDVDVAGCDMLTSRVAPVGIVPKSDTYDLAPAVAPCTRTIGLMLPYTPLHHLLFHDVAYDALVMTSANRSDEPICYLDEDAFSRLRDIADGFLVHNRPIHTRCDDSVTRQTENGTVVIRRARGYAPEPIRLREQLCAPILTCGGHLKHTFCLGVGERAYVSHHIGDLKNETTWRAFTEGVEHYCRLFDVAPQYVAHDLHPDYLSTRYAESLDVPAIAIQHHHAHVASCLADNVWPYDEPAIGLAFDGTGYGDDGTLWGGEWLLVDGSGHRRIAHMRPLALPGGEQAIRQPWRLAAYAMHELFGDEWPNWSLPVERYLDSHVWPLLQTAMVRNINCPSTSAIGRLFDTVAALVGVRGVANYEAQGPVEFEQIADHHADGEYPFPTCTGSDPIQLDWQPGVANIVDDIRNDVPVGVISMRYHRGLARGVAALTSRVAAAERLNTIALSGGVFQNALFTNMLLSMLRDEGLQVLTHRSMPPNDGGISLGQLVVANRQIAATK